MQHRESLKPFFQRIADADANAALIQFAGGAMAARLAAKAHEGRGGWHGASCDTASLHDLLAKNLAKGDMIDVMNLAAMIQVRGELYGETTTPAQRALQAAPVVLNPADLPRRHLDASGNPVEGGSASHVITHFNTAGLMFDIRKPRDVGGTDAAWAAARECDLLGRRGEWVIGKDYENNLILDRDFRAPAVNPKSFPNMPSEGLIYCDRQLKGSSGLVWFVSLGDGDVYWSYGDCYGLAVPCLRVPPSQ